MAGFRSGSSMIQTCVDMVLSLVLPLMKESGWHMPTLITHPTSRVSAVSSRAPRPDARQGSLESENNRGPSNSSTSLAHPDTRSCTTSGRGRNGTVTQDAMRETVRDGPACRQERLSSLVEHMLSPEVQVKLPAQASDEPVRLSDSQVAKVFVDHVPGVSKLLFREQRGKHVLDFLKVGYRDGFSAFRGTPLNQHLTRLLRAIVHHGYDQKPGAAANLAQVAEAFMDCQAVQARVVERVGLRVQGLSFDFRGAVDRLVGEYKSMALRMLAAERLAQGKAQDDATPTHYENRLTADLGNLLGLDAADVRRASLDQHAHRRFAPVREPEASAAAARCRELFDVDALLKALASEVNSLDEDSTSASLPRIFLEWAESKVPQRHVVLDEVSCSRIDIDESFTLAVLEVLYFGYPKAAANEFYRGERLSDLFASH